MIDVALNHCSSRLGHFSPLVLIRQQREFEAAWREFSKLLVFFFLLFEKVTAFATGLQERQETSAALERNGYPSLIRTQLIQIGLLTLFSAHTAS